MSQRIAKVESLVQQVVASSLPELLETEAARVTITGVDVSPDLRNATVWVGMLVDDEAAQQELFAKVESARAEVQRRLAGTITTKFVPKLFFKLDTGGKYAEYITRLLNNL